MIKFLKFREKGILIDRSLLKMGKLKLIALFAKKISGNFYQSFAFLGEKKFKKMIELRMHMGWELNEICIDLTRSLSKFFCSKTEATNEFLVFYLQSPDFVSVIYSLFFKLLAFLMHAFKIL